MHLDPVMKYSTRMARHPFHLLQDPANMPASMDREQLQLLILDSVEDSDIAPFRGRVPVGLGRSTARALMFKITCHCGVTAMLSVDTPEDASEERILEMVPHLAKALDNQAAQFRRFPCEAHSRMSMG